MFRAETKNQGRTDRVDEKGQSVGAPTSRRVDRLNRKSLLGYLWALDQQSPDGANNPEMRAAALEVSRDRAVTRLGELIEGD